MKHHVLLALANAYFLRSVEGTASSERSDVVVFGATPGGIAAAIEAAANGKNRVTLLVPSRHVGGMTAGGLGWDDVWPAPQSAEDLEPVYGENGTYARFTANVLEHYSRVSQTAAQLSAFGTRHEPHVAEQIFLRMLAEAGVSDIRYGVELDTVTLSADGAVVKSLTFKVAPELAAPPSAGVPEKTATVISAAYFVDATYLGDLMAQATAGWTIGREGRAEYGELNAGVVFTSGSTFTQGSTGLPSPRIPAMTWRMCFTTNATNRVALEEPPPSYNRTRYLGYVEDVKANRSATVFSAWSGPRALPPTGTKFDMNCSPRHLGFIWTGPEKEELVTANATRRAELRLHLRNMALGLLWFQQHDDAVSAHERASNQAYGLCADEFKDNGHFPTALYVREARRLKVANMFIELDMVAARPGGRPRMRPDSVAVGTFPIDAFPASDVRPAEGGTSLEGYIGMQTSLNAPNTLPVEMMLPPNVTNLVVSVAVGASHVAFSSVRLEPTWMLLGSAAGTLVRLALERNPTDPRSSSSVGGVDGLGSIPLLTYQSEVAALHPLIKYDDLSSVPAGQRLPMQVLGPHGVGQTIRPSFHAAAADVLTRGLATVWLYGAVLAANSTVRRLATARPVPAGASGWADLSANDPFFPTAWRCADAGWVAPPPSARALFNPHDPILPSDWDAWLAKAFALEGRAPDRPQRRASALDKGAAAAAATATISRGDAAALLYAQALRRSVQGFR